MNFRPELAQAVINGRKTVTRRLVSDNPRSPYSLERAPKMVGKRIAICPGRGKHNIGFATVASVKRETFNPMGMARKHLRPEVRREGFSSWNDFLSAWLSLHGNADPVDVWRIELCDASEERA